MKVGRFEIVRELGRGAQSVVYLARDPKLEREIAIKTLHFTRQDRAQNQALLDEARTVSKLRHPNIVPIFEAGEEGEDIYLVFEYVPGADLAHAIQDQGALPALRAVTILRPVLDAVAYAHANGIVHRDLKPSNILLDESGTARVMDFGIAARFSDQEDGKADLIGTPAYMAPEYIERRESSERTDVFSAGLVFYEMLFGRRAIDGTNLFQLMHQLANQDIEIPRGGTHPLDEKLAAVLRKALARRPADRYASASEFRQALDGYLDPAGEVLAAGGDLKQSTMEFLLRRLRHSSDFPALSESVSAINRIAESEGDSVNKLSNTILRDFALTNKILRLVNSAFYRHSVGGRISTVSRAVLVLGFDAVRNLAITVLLYEHLQKTPGMSHLMDEFLKSNLSGLIARQLGRKVGSHDGEQSFICALFQNLGRLLSQYYFAEESEAIRKLMLHKSVGEGAASLQVLGISFEELGVGIAKSWGFPALIVGSMRRVPKGRVTKPNTAEERLRLLSSFANELCEIVVGVEPAGRERALAQISARFAPGLTTDAAELKATLQHSFEEMAQLARVVHFNMQGSAVGKQIRSWISAAPAGTPEAAAAAADAGLGDALLGDPVPGAPGTHAGAADAQSVLTAGIQDISNSLVEGVKLNDVLRIILETMYRAMGFRRVILCVRDAKTNTMLGRFGFGPDANDVLRHFRIPLSGAPDVFLVALTKGVDILISDVDDEQIRARIPQWFRKQVGAPTFVLLPLTIKATPVALIYADRERAGEIVIPEKELSLLKTLRNQAILAIKQGN